MNSSAFCVELAVVAAFEQLAVAGYGPQRFLQVVRGDVGELLELGIGARQLGRGAVQGVFGGFALGDVARDHRQIRGAGSARRTGA